MKNRNNNRGRRSTIVGLISQLIGLVILLVLGYLYYSNYIQGYSFPDGIVKSIEDFIGFFKKLPDFLSSIGEGDNLNG